MKKLTFWKSLFLLCALIVGSSSAWAQSDYSALYSSNVTLSTSGGTNASTAKVKLSSNGTEYDALKAGTGKAAGAVKITVPSGAKYLHLHVAAWNGESVTLSVTQGSTSVTSIDLTADAGIANNSPFTLSTPANATTNYYKVITFASALTANTDYTFTATSGKRFVVWGVNSEAASSDPSSEVTFTNKTPSISYPATKTYSQVPTTAAGYGGTITYTMTENTAGATIDASTGLVTVTKGGSVTVKALAAAVPGSFSGSEDTYTLTVNDTRTSAGLVWSAASANVTYGADNNVFPTLTNTHSVPVTYESTNQAAATIDANTGEITLKDYTGITTISAIFAGNDDYLPQTVTYELNVTKAPFAVKDGVFDFVEAGSSSPVVDYGSGIAPSSDTGYIYDEISWVAGSVTMVTKGKLRWWNNDKTLRFYSYDPASKATFSVPDGYVITKIVSAGGNFSNCSVGTLSGATWTGCTQSVALSTGSSNINFTKFTVTYTTANQTFTPAKTYTTLTSAYALDFTTVSDDLKAFIAIEVDGDKVKMTQVNKVPANTGLVLKATTPNSAVNVPVFDGASPDDVSGNKMVGSATETTAIEKDGGYILSDGIFQPANAGTLAAGKAYLQIAVTSARSLEMSFDDATTGIANLNVDDNFDTNAPMYNLAGQRVNKSYKGVVIVNGKKMLNK